MARFAERRNSWPLPVSASTLTSCAVAIAALTTVSCSGSPSDTPTPHDVTVRDSMGVQIVEVPGESLHALPVWTIARAPIVSVGEVDGDADYVFGGIHPSGIAPLADGSLAVVDGLGRVGSREVRIFDAAGQVVRKFGRAGEGPGEFGSVPRVRRGVDGGLVAVEGGAKRVTHFDLEGNVLATQVTAVTECPNRPCAVLGGLGSGGLVLYSFDRAVVMDEGAIGQTFDDLTSSYGVWVDDAYREAAQLPQPRHTVLRRQDLNMPGAGGPPIQLSPVATVPPLLAPSPNDPIAVGERHFVVATSEPFEFRLFDEAGTLVRIIRIDRAPTPVTLAEQEAAIEARPPIARFENHQAAEFRPQFGRMRFGEGDDLWVSDWDPGLFGEGAVERITIFGSDGMPVARLEVPADPVFGELSRGDRALAVSSRDQVRMVAADSLGVERVLVFEVVR